MKPITFVSDAQWHKAVQTKSLYVYRSIAITRERREFIDRKLHEMRRCEIQYQPNPWHFQYDLEVHIFLHYHRLNDQEIKFLTETLAKTTDGESKEIVQHRLDQVRQNGFTGIPREEHLLRAMELRWPTIEVEGGPEDGKWEGVMIRNEWLERFCAAVARCSYVIMFGGGGQGKTNMAIAFSMIIWDHFIYTRKGARCPFSTVSESKLMGATWPAALHLYNASQKGISLYGGQGKVSSKYTIRRPPDDDNNKLNLDSAGNIVGILVGSHLDQKKINDKLTGTHGHPAHVYIIDEIQSTPPGPLNAAPNFQQSSTFKWVIGCGNYGDDDDLLAKNCRPKDGWDTVDEFTPQWETITELGRRVIVIHYHNDNSPGMTDPKRFGFFPTAEKYRENYPTVISRNSDEHRRFWRGWRLDGGKLSDTVLSRIMIQTNRANLPIEFDRRYPITSFLTLDSAPSEKGDRNCVGVFQDGVCADTGYWKFKPVKMYELGKGNNDFERQQHYKRTTQQVLNIAKAHEVPQHLGIIADHTQFSAYPEMLADQQYTCVLMGFAMGIPDGFTRNEYSEEVEEAITFISARNEYLHQKAHDRASGGAMALRTYVEYGRIGNVKDNLILEAASDQEHLPDVDKELYRRIWEQQPNKQYGNRFKLGSKKVFKSKYGMSPDWLDIYIMAAWYMIAIRRLVPDNFNARPPDSDGYLSIGSQMDSMNEIYNDILIQR